MLLSYRAYLFDPANPHITPTIRKVMQKWRGKLVALFLVENSRLRAYVLVAREMCLGLLGMPARSHGTEAKQKFGC